MRHNFYFQSPSLYVRKEKKGIAKQSPKPFIDLLALLNRSVYLFARYLPFPGKCIKKASSFSHLRLNYYTKK